MELVVVLALLVGVFVAIDLAWTPPAWLRRLSDAVADRVPEQRLPAGAALDLDVDGVPDVTPSAARGSTGSGTTTGDAALPWTLFPPEFVHRRLLELSAELDRLDRDRSIFARAFHTLAARSAYDALRAEEHRLVDVRPPALVGAPASRREELDL